MKTLKEFMKESLDNPLPLLKDFEWHFPPVIYYVINKKTNEILFSFLDKSFLSYESFLIISKLMNNIEYLILTKEKYEELYGVQNE